MKVGHRGFELLEPVHYRVNQWSRVIMFKRQSGACPRHFNYLSRLLTRSLIQSLKTLSLLGEGSFRTFQSALFVGFWIPGMVILVKILYESLQAALEGVTLSCSDCSMYFLGRDQQLLRCEGLLRSCS
ncbi:hypothetical protein ACOSQ2_005717 [Xanthoceras sorbifolium]